MTDDSNDSRDLIDAGLAYWNSRRGTREMPTRADIDPADIKRLLPHVVLVDVLPDPLDFRFRLLGTEVDRIVGTNPLGMRFSDIPHMREGSTIWARHAGVVASRAPSICTIDYVGPDRHVGRQIRQLHAPLTDTEGSRVVMIFTILQIERIPQGGPTVE